MKKSNKSLVNKSLLTSAIIAFPLAVAAQFSHAEGQTSETSFSACKPVFELYNSVENGVNCLESIGNALGQYVNATIAEKKEAVIESQLYRNITDVFAVSTDEQEIYLSDLASYTKHLDLEKIEKACNVEGNDRQVYVEKIVDAVPDTGVKRETLVGSINEMLDRGWVC